MGTRRLWPREPRVLPFVFGKVYTAQDRKDKALLAHYLMPYGRLPRYTIEFNLPTEVVIDAPQFVVPRKGRLYDTEQLLYEGQVYTCEDLQRMLRRKREQFAGTSQYPHVYLAEVWEDYGNDGHTEYSHMGWLFAHSGILNVKEPGLAQRISHLAYEVRFQSPRGE